MTLSFTRATRAQVPLKIGIMGVSGSGKTTAALKLTRGLVGPDAPIALLDTENGSASLYCDLTTFDVLNMTPPYNSEKFIAAIEAAHLGGYKALVIDSASHEWIQILQDKEALDARGGNQWTNWAGFTKKHEAFLTAIRNAPIHLILCLRAKEKHEMNDAKKVVKMGVGSQMRDGFEYEVTTCFDITMDHSAKATKDRTRLFDGRIEPISEATGKELATWLASGKLMAENTGEGFAPPAVVGAKPATPAIAPKPATATVAATAARPTTVTRPSAPKPQQVATRPTQASGPATPPSRSASPTQTHSTAPTQTSGTPQASSATELPPEWVTAMVELSEVSMGMPEKTRAALIADFESEGPAALPALLAEIAKMKGVLDPQTPGAVIAQMERPANAPVSQEAADFVDGMADGPDAPDGAIKDYQYEALGQLITAYGLDRDALRSYMAKAGHLLPGANGPTLARMKTDAFTRLRDKLHNQTIAGAGETWSARTIRLINATPITTYAPIKSAS